LPTKTTGLLIIKVTLRRVDGEKLDLEDIGEAMVTTLNDTFDGAGLVSSSKVVVQY
jgi:hypothetical protein